MRRLPTAEPAGASVSSRDLVAFDGVTLTPNAKLRESGLTDITPCSVCRPGRSRSKTVGGSRRNRRRETAMCKTTQNGNTASHPHCRRRAGRCHHRAGARPPGPAGACVRGRSPGQRHAARGDHPRRDAGDAGRPRHGRRGHRARPGRTAVPHLGPPEQPDDRRIRFRHAQERDALSVCRAMRAAQAGRHGDRAAEEISPRQGRILGAGDVADPILRWRRDRGRDRRRHAQGRGLVSDQRRGRTLDRAQGTRHRVRGLHPPRTLHDPDHDRQHRHPVSGLHPELHLRSRRLVLGVQGERRRGRPALAGAVLDTARADR